MASRLMHLTASLCSTGFHPAGWRLAQGPAFPVGRRFQAMAQTAEQAKLDAILLGPMADLPLDPLPLLGSLIAVTARIGLGAYWTVDHTEPFHVARVFATLDHLSAGRTAWIAGLFDAVKHPADFGHAVMPEDSTAYGERTAELIDLVRALWDSWEDEGLLLDVASGRFADPAHVHPVNHAGRYFTVRGPLNVPRPLQGNPPVVMTLPVELAARQIVAASADVVLLDCADIQTALALRRDLTVRIAAAGRRADAVRVLVNIMPVLGSTTDEAARRAQALDAMAPAGKTMRWTGTAEHIVDQFVAWTEQGVCDGFNLMPAVLPDDLAPLCSTVVAHAQARGVFRSDYDGSSLRAHLDLDRPRSRFAA